MYTVYVSIHYPIGHTHYKNMERTNGRFVQIVSILYKPKYLYSILLHKHCRCRLIFFRFRQFSRKNRLAQNKPRTVHNIYHAINSSWCYTYISSLYLFFFSDDFWMNMSIIEIIKLAFLKTHLYNVFWIEISKRDIIICICMPFVTCCVLLYLILKIIKFCKSVHDMYLPPLSFYRLYFPENIVME